MAAPLYDPAEHRPLDAPPWTDQAARVAIEQIAQDAIGAYAGPERLWPNRVADLEGDPDVPLRTAYLGAAGVAWALAVLARDGLAPELPGLDELARRLPDGYAGRPEFLALIDEPDPSPPPSLLFGESGVRLASEAILGDGGQHDGLHAAIARNARHPATELCWGSPGTMAVALELWRATGEARWREAWRDAAAWLLDEAEADEGLWIQALYGQRSRYVGAGHGFAGTAGSLVGGAGLLDADDRARLFERVRATIARLARVDNGLAQWPAVADRATERQPVQWCHGAPGIVTSLSSLPADPRTDELLLAGGELTWRAGPLRKGVGLCHGTAGNGFALLALSARTGREEWLERARAFAMDAAADVARRRQEAGGGRYTLWTGDLGVAMFLRGCLLSDHRFPWLEGMLDMVGGRGDVTPE